MLTTSPPTTPNEGIPGPACLVTAPDTSLECERGTAGCFVDHDPLTEAEIAAIGPVEDLYAVLRTSRF